MMQWVQIPGLNTEFLTLVWWCDTICHTISLNLQCLDCLLDRLFRRRWKKTSKLRVTGLWKGNPPVTDGFPSQRTSNTEDVSIWWRHYVIVLRLFYIFQLLRSWGSTHEYWTLRLAWLLCWITTFSGAAGTWWRHQMETFSALLALCAGNSPVTGAFHSPRPVTQSFDVFFDLCLNKRLSKQSWGWRFETPSRSLWHHCNEILKH